jgi:hypothetical protein
MIDLRKGVFSMLGQNRNLKKIHIVNCLSELLIFIETYHSDDDYVFWPDLSTSHYDKETTQ